MSNVALTPKLTYCEDNRLSFNLSSLTHRDSSQDTERNPEFVQLGCVLLKKYLRLVPTHDNLIFSKTSPFITKEIWYIFPYFITIQEDLCDIANNETHIHWVFNTARGNFL